MNGRNQPAKGRLFGVGVGPGDPELVTVKAARLIGSAPVLAYFATSWHLGLAIPMMVGTALGAISFIVALLVSPETKGTEMVADLVVT